MRREIGVGKSRWVGVAGWVGEGGVREEIEVGREVKRGEIEVGGGGGARGGSRWVGEGW